MCVNGAPCSKSSGGPSPPVTRLIVAPDVWTFTALKPGGKNLVVSVCPCGFAVRAATAAVLAISAAVDCWKKVRRFIEALSRGISPQRHKDTKVWRLDVPPDLGVFVSLW